MWYFIRYLGHLYMAEALVALDRIADGIQHLNPELVTDINTLPPEQKSDQGKFLFDQLIGLMGLLIFKTCHTEDRLFSGQMSDARSKMLFNFNFYERPSLL